jgi:hypothetical protein
MVSNSDASNRYSSFEPTTTPGIVVIQAIERAGRRRDLNSPSALGGLPDLQF